MILENFEILVLKYKYLSNSFSCLKILKIYEFCAQEAKELLREKNKAVSIKIVNFPKNIDKTKLKKANDKNKNDKFILNL